MEIDQLCDMRPACQTLREWPPVLVPAIYRNTRKVAVCQFSAQLAIRFFRAFPRPGGPEYPRRRGRAFAADTRSHISLANCAIVQDELALASPLISECLAASY